MRNYIPTQDAQLLAFARAFSAGIQARPSAYGLMASDAASIRDYVQEFADAMTASSDPGTRTQAAVAAKDGAKAAMLSVLRGYAQMIKRNAGISNEDKIAVGVPIADSVHTPVPVPTTQPLLSIIGATPLSHTIRFSDAATPDVRAKPPGAAALLLYKYVGNAPPTAPEQATFIALVTRQPYLVALPAAEVGKSAYYYAKWVTRTGLEGPWSAPTAMTIAA